jgi:hypothetical protein
VVLRWRWEVGEWRVEDRTGRRNGFLGELVWLLDDLYVCWTVAVFRWSVQITTYKVMPVNTFRC